MAQPAAPDARAVPGPLTRGIVACLLLVAIGGALVVPIYARSLPKLGAFPFFYWYQLLLVPVVAAACWLCYVLLRTKPAAQDSPPGAPSGNGAGPAQAGADR